MLRQTGPSLEPTCSLGVFCQQLTRLCPAACLNPQPADCTTPPKWLDMNPRTDVYQRVPYSTKKKNKSYNDAWFSPYILMRVFSCSENCPGLSPASWGHDSPRSSLRNRRTRRIACNHKARQRRLPYMYLKQYMFASEHEVVPSRRQRSNSIQQQCVTHATRAACNCDRVPCDRQRMTPILATEMVNTYTQVLRFHLIRWPCIFNGGPSRT